MLKSLGELQYEFLKPPFLRFVLREALDDSGLLCGALDICMTYWVETIRDADDRDSLWLLAESLVPRHFR